MKELVVNYTNIKVAVLDLQILKNRIQKYSNKSYSMEESSGSAAKAMLSASQSFTKIAKKLEEHIDTTITEVNHASTSFKNTDNKLADQMK